MAQPPCGWKRFPVWRLSLLTLAALAGRVVYCAAVAGLGELPGPEYREYVTLGRELLHHGALANALTPDAVPPQLTAMYPPVYAIFVWFVFRLGGAESPAAIAALQCFNALCTALLVPFAWDIVRRSGVPLRWAWLGAILVAAHPVLIAITPRAWDTALFALGATVAVWLVLFTSRKRPLLSIPPQDRSDALTNLSSGNSDDNHRSESGVTAFLIRTTLGYGAYLGALAHLNPALTPCYPLLTLWLIRRMQGPRAWQATVVGVLCTLVGWAAVSLPWTLRNHRVLGTWTYVRSGAWQEVWFGCCPEAERGFAAVLNAHMPLRSAATRERFIEVGEADYIRSCKKQSMAAIESNPSRYVRLCIRRAADYWLGTTYTLLGDASPVLPPTWSRRGVALFLTGETAVMVLALWWGRRGSPDLRWLAGVVVLFSLTYALTHVEVRYRAPIEPFMAMVIVIGAAHRRASRVARDPACA